MRFYKFIPDFVECNLKTSRKLARLSESGNGRRLSGIAGIKLKADVGRKLGM